MSNWKCSVPAAVCQKLQKQRERNLQRDEEMPNLNDLSQHQVELAFKLVDETLKSEGRLKKLEIPSELSHLDQIDWNVLSATLQMLQIEKEHCQVH